MTLDVSHARQILPCFVCGDLPPQIAVQVQALLDAHPQLAAEADALKGAEGACRALMERLAEEYPDDLLDFDDLSLSADPDPVPTLAAPLRPWMALLAAAASLLLVVGAVTALHASQPALQGLPDQHALHVAADDPAFIAQTDPATLGQALVAGGVEPGLAMVPDLSALGLDLVGGQPVSGRPGAVLVYQGQGGHRYVCQLYSGAPPTDPPDAVRHVAGTTLRGFQRGNLGVVVWQAYGMFCMFTGDGPVDQLLAMISKRVALG
ncbi:MAG: hypothetical protein GXP62_08685 [Oligoflexia bacterium]|nr:hypothetical protein [Oligoflexia bacterium]